VLSVHTVAQPFCSVSIPSEIRGNSQSRWLTRKIQSQGCSNFFIPLLNAMLPFAARPRANSLKSLLAASVWHVVLVLTGRRVHAVRVPLIAPPFAFHLDSTAVTCLFPFCASPHHFRAITYLTLHYLSALASSLIHRLLLRARRLSSPQPAPGFLD
jgi:hypothetical protein